MTGNERPQPAHGLREVVRRLTRPVPLLVLAALAVLHVLATEVAPWAGGPAFALSVVVASRFLR